MPEDKLVPVCECENALHFEKHLLAGEPHEYAALIFAAEDVRNVVTDYGTFQICVRCAQLGHMIDRSNLDQPVEGIRIVAKPAVICRHDSESPETCGYCPEEGK